MQKKKKIDKNYRQKFKNLKPKGARGGGVGWRENSESARRSGASGLPICTVTQ